MDLLTSRVVTRTCSEISVADVLVHEPYMGDVDHDREHFFIAIQMRYLIGSE